mmetsp:Transcript_133422/g.345393  ORF Transcript_133422/g.345393 Transcript_133422/m.345393 type:complete len:347 (+) Transcript_133422:126-1166(+)
MDTRRANHRRLSSAGGCAVGLQPLRLLPPPRPSTGPAKDEACNRLRARKWSSGRRVAFVVAATGDGGRHCSRRAEKKASESRQLIERQAVERAPRSAQGTKCTASSSKMPSNTVFNNRLVQYKFSHSSSSSDSGDVEANSGTPNREAAPLGVRPTAEPALSSAGSASEVLAPSSTPPCAAQLQGGRGSNCSETSHSRRLLLLLLRHAGLVGAEKASMASSLTLHVRCTNMESELGELGSDIGSAKKPPIPKSRSETEMSVRSVDVGHIVEHPSPSLSQSESELEPARLASLRRKVLAASSLLRRLRRPLPPPLRPSMAKRTSRSLKSFPTFCSSAPLSLCNLPIRG